MYRRYLKDEHTYQKLNPFVEQGLVGNGGGWQRIASRLPRKIEVYSIYIVNILKMHGHSTSFKSKKTTYLRSPPTPGKAPKQKAKQAKNKNKKKLNKKLLNNSQINFYTRKLINTIKV